MSSTSFDNNELLAKRLELKNQKLSLLLELTQAINQNFSDKTLFTIYRYILSDNLGIPYFMLFIYENEGWEVAIANNINPMAQLDHHWIADLKDYVRPQKLSHSVKELHNLHYVVPVLHKNQPLAYLLLGDLPWVETDWVKEMLDYMQSLTNIVVVANENKKLFSKTQQQQKLNEELHIARQIQALLVPKNLPKHPFFSVAARYLPNREVSGDYYDCFQDAAGVLWFCIGDVSGKGVPAALLMSNFQAHVKALIQSGIALEDIAQTLNKRIFDITEGDRFISFFIGFYNANTHTGSYVNCGHPPALLINKHSVNRLQLGCTLLGAFPFLPKVQCGNFSLNKGDILVLYTDGIAELENYRNRAYGEERLTQLIQNNTEESTESIAEIIVTDLESYTPRQKFSDDITLLVLKYC